MKAEEGGLRWGAFTDAGEERAFRRHHFDDATRQALLTIAFTTVFSWASIRNDFTLTNDLRLSYALVGLRVVHALVGVCVALVARRTRAPDPSIDAVSLWLVATAGAKFLLLTTRPPDFHGHEQGDIVFLLIAPLALPVPYARQIGAMFLFAALDAVIAIGFREPVTQAVAIARISTYAIAMTLGALAAHRLQTMMRREFRTLRIESELKESLEVALSEVRTLRGIVPICSGCHGIRDDEGYWHTVEAYVHAHTHADFSHGLCPACVTRLYPAIADEVLRQRADEATPPS